MPSTNISVKTKDNDTCNITGICFLSPIHLAAVDNYNVTVKLIDIEQEKVITELSVGKTIPSDRPWDVTKINSDQLAVTVPHSKIICFLQLTCCFGIDLISLSIARTVPVNCLCYGIVYHNNKLIISVAGDPCSVRMLDLDGNVLQRFNEDREGEKLFSLPYYVILSKTCNSLYVSSYGNGNVTRLSMDGTVLAVYKHEQLKDVFGMTIDKAGKVYVLGYNNIFQLSEDLTEGHQVLVNNRMNNNIAYCEKTNSFWLAFHDQDYILNISV
jgi:DNA-binding beta-propeller fold protein YncE